MVSCRDEANLEANEEIKRDLNPTKITEPKTPYRSPMATDDELDLGAGPQFCWVPSLREDALSFHCWTESSWTVVTLAQQRVRESHR